MDSVSEYLAMGGYARFVWPAYGLTALVMLGLLAWSWRTLKARERQLASLQAVAPRRRGR